jgi:hypothetical protein
MVFYDLPFLESANAEPDEQGGPSNPAGRKKTQTEADNKIVQRTPKDG